MGHDESVLDPEVASWAEGAGGEARELIVEALLPTRRVTLSEAGAGGRRLVDISPTGDRQAALEQVGDQVGRIVGGEVTVLKAAGAIAVRATAEQARRLGTLSEVRAIRFNRRLR